MEIHVVFNDRDLQVFNEMAGIATGYAFGHQMGATARAFMRLANRVNANNPDWSSISVPEESGEDNYYSRG